jgi:hypothetical protein
VGDLQRQGGQAAKQGDKNDLPPKAVKQCANTKMPIPAGSETTVVGPAQIRPGGVGK